MENQILTDARPIAFVATAKPAAANQFYGSVLGFHLVADEEFALVFVMPGKLTLRVQKVAQLGQAVGTVLGWSVNDIAKTMGQLRERGVAFEFFGLPGQSEDGLCTFPNGDQVAWFRDPDGNMLSLTQPAHSEPLTP